MTTALGGYLVAQKIAAAVTAAQVETDEAVLLTMEIPGDATIVDIILTSTDLDTGGIPTLALDVGDASGPALPDDDRFIASSQIGRTGGTVRWSDTDATAVYTYSTTGTQEIEVTVDAVAATGAAGTVTLTVIYFR